METRVQKYKEYRSSFIKEGSQKYSGQSRYTTTTLPLNEVMSSVSNEDNVDLIAKKKKRLLWIKYILMGVIAIAIIVGVVFLGIYALKG